MLWIYSSAAFLAAPERQSWRVSTRCEGQNFFTVPTEKRWWYSVSLALVLMVEWVSNCCGQGIMFIYLFYFKLYCFYIHMCVCAPACLSVCLLVCSSVCLSLPIFWGLNSGLQVCVVSLYPTKSPRLWWRDRSVSALRLFICRGPIFWR